VRKLLVFTVFFAAAASGCQCGSSSSPCDGHIPAAGGDTLVQTEDGRQVGPSRYQDPWELQARMPGSSFVEILEVRAVDDKRVMFCSGVSGVNVVDVSNPAAPERTHQLVSSLSSPSFPRCQHLASSGDVVYFSNRGDEIQPTPFVAAVDISGEAREVGVYTESGRSFEGLAVDGAYVYAAMHGDGVAVLELTASTLELRATISDFENAWGLAISDDVLYVADGTGGLVTVDVTDPTNASLLGRVETGGSAQSVEIDADAGVAFVAAGTTGLVTIDVTDPNQPTLLATVDTPGSALQVALANGHAYIADWNDARVFDVQDPSSPTLIATERVPVSRGFPRVLGIGANGQHAYLGEWTGLYSYRLTPERSAPDLQPSQRTVRLNGVADGSEAAFALILTNQGNAPLVAWSLSTTEGPFSVSPSELHLEPNAQAAVEIRYAPEAGADTSACMAVLSDDPDEPTLKIELLGNEPAAGLGQQAPEVVARLVDGGVWRLSEQRGKVVVLSYFATF
jgi:hypothetical protein